MSEAAPFPLSSAEQTLSALGRVIFVEERGEYVPAWYEPHTNPEKILVTYQGEPFAGGFTVAEMPIEHRWAVQANGEVLPREEFQRCYIRWRDEWFQYASPEARAGRPGRPPNWKPENEHCPNVLDFVSLRPDPRDTSKLIQMDYHPEATAGTRPTRLWDSKNERYIEGEERLQKLAEAYREDPRVLKDYEREEVEAWLGGAPQKGPEASGLQAKLEVLNQLKEDGTLTAEQHSAKVSALFGVESQPASEAQAQPEEPPKKKAPSSIMACGEEVMNLHKRKHLDSCETCREDAEA